MSRKAPALAVALLMLAACSSPDGALPSQGRQASSNDGGRIRTVRALHVEPFEIVYSRRHKRPRQPVRVWQKGYLGTYTADNQCVGVTVSLQRYTDRNASIWYVKTNRQRDESCVVKFTGGPGHRGTNYLHIRILR